MSHANSWLTYMLIKVVYGIAILTGILQLPFGKKEFGFSVPAGLQLSRCVCAHLHLIC